MKTWVVLCVVWALSIAPVVHGATPMRKATISTTFEKQKKNHSIGAAVKGGYEWYLHQCTYNPFVTKSITAACIASTGDLMAQKLEARVAKKPFELNRMRLSTFFLCGLVYTGPFLHQYYEVLAKFGRWLHKKYDVSNAQQVFAQLFADQTLGVAIFFPPFFYIYECFESLVHWTPPDLIKAHGKCLEQLKDVVLMQYRVYPLANAINLGLVPEQLRTLFSNAVSVFWNIYLCSILA